MRSRASVALNSTTSIAGDAGDADDGGDAGAAGEQAVAVITQMAIVN
jgi:hypothetical protein